MLTYLDRVPSPPSNRPPPHLEIRMIHRRRVKYQFLVLIVSIFGGWWMLNTLIRYRLEKRKWITQLQSKQHGLVARSFVIILLSLIRQKLTGKYFAHAILTKKRWYLDWLHYDHSGVLFARLFQNTEISSCGHDAGWDVSASNTETNMPG